MLPRGQDWLLDKMTRAGYDVNKEGICAGLDSMAVQALLAKEIENFNKRLSTIENLSNEELDLIKQMESSQRATTFPSTSVSGNTQEEKRSKPEASDTRYKLTDIRIFFEGIQRYFNPAASQHLFLDQIVTQQSIMPLATLLQ